MNVTFIINNINPDLFPDYDLLNPPRTVPSSIDDDESLPEALELADRLKEVTHESELRRIVWEAFRGLFMDEIAGDRDSAEYRDAIFDAWKYYVR